LAKAEDAVFRPGVNLYRAVAGAFTWTADGSTAV
jgi:hypothetical protein